MHGHTGHPTVQNLMIKRNYVREIKENQWGMLHIMTILFEKDKHS